MYPDDWVNEVHEDGLIFGGAVWDLWELLEEQYGEDEAYDKVNRLFVQAVKAGPTTPEAFDEFIFADDDNGNLGDGTPNSCTIIEAFSRHGLGPGGNGGLVQLNHEPVGVQPANDDIRVDLNVVNMAPQCTDVTIEAAELVYSIDQGLLGGARPFAVMRSNWLPKSQPRPMAQWCPTIFCTNRRGSICSGAAGWTHQSIHPVCRRAYGAVL